MDELDGNARTDEMDVARGLEPRTDRIEMSTDIRVAKNDGHLMDAGPI